MALLVIHTGGTIGMVQTDQGFAPSAGVLETAIQAIQSSGDLSDEVEVHAFDPLIDSAQASPNDWAKIAQTIHECYEHFDGFVVTHGTDTLAYTAAALCLALRGVQKPVIVTGAMLPLTVEGTDGTRNLRDALCAATKAPSGVWVQFAGNLLHGGRVRKSHSHAFDAFEAEVVSTPPAVAADAFALARVGDHRVGMVSITPGTCTELIRFAADTCAGIVLRCYGSGTAPDTPALRAALHRAQERQIPVVAVSQCAEGGIRLGTYAAGGILRETGVIDGRDMTPEMAYAKIQFALSQFDNIDSQHDYLTTCQCGEYTAA
ncbi:asparaginase [Donghicola sp. XS_ASV15]|uniref:asparaginase n=1 Tax=Donghicola sp. XS_ASV15 TaxID=3241295 RepID=UPI0035167C5C